MAHLLKTTRRTVVRKLLFLEKQANADHERFLATLFEKGIKFTKVQFDEMETFERSKCLPISIGLVVTAETRKILGFELGTMPAKGPLSKISLRKYGPREDQRPEKIAFLFDKLLPVINPCGTMTTDQNPKYPSWIKRPFPKIKHFAVKGRRGCVVGQGELKKIGFDPLFDLNHTCAMIRANVNRLFRRTWCTTKRIDRLKAHLTLYMHYHNTVLTKPLLISEIAKM